MVVKTRLRQMAFVLLVALPTIAGQECNFDDQCPGELCCMDDGQCSMLDKDSVLPGGAANDICECTHNILGDNGSCECRFDAQCPDDTCCMDNGECSPLDKDSVLPGGAANDMCECTHGILGEDGFCKCAFDTQCPGDTCCMVNGECSPLDKDSVLPGEAADDMCECTHNIIGDDGFCKCRFDGQCSGDTCCTENGGCSLFDDESVLPGGAASDICECMSNVLGDDGFCKCAFDAQCPGDTCCMVNGECSPLDKDSVLPGEAANDMCECTHNIIGDDGFCKCAFDIQCIGDQICCPATNTCEDEPANGNLDACGDPHITGFYGQKFDFTGEDGSWYALIADPTSLHVNMRITAPVPTTPEITYITGISVITSDADGFDHSIVITVKEPHSLASVCPTNVSPCLADGSLNVVVDGEAVLSGPGAVILAPGVEVTAVNLPGECRSFGFETYWERKKLEYGQADRRMTEAPDIGEWILADPTVTNIVECTEYVASAMMDNHGIFEHQSEHASFKIVTPSAIVRLSHGRLHQLPMRDPTDQFDLPDHLTWQMNVAIDHADVSLDAKGILGETVVPTRDANGGIIMKGMESIRGLQEDYSVAGPLGMVFAADGNNNETQNESVGAKGQTTQSKYIAMATR